MLNRAVPRIVGTRLSRLCAVSGPSPPVHLAHADPFARARIAAVQSRVAAPVLSDPRPPPPAPAFSPFRDGHYWCSKCPRRGFTTIPGLMRHVTHQHAGSSVDEATCSLFAAIRTSHLHGSRLWWPQKNGRSGLQSMRAGQSGQTPSSGRRHHGPSWCSSSREDVVMADVEALPRPASPLISPSLTSRLTSRNASVRFPQAPFCTSLPAAVCA